MTEELSDVVGPADRRSAVAERVMGILDIPGRWGAMGKPYVVGSVALNVVVRPDIDLEVYADRLDPTIGFACMAPLAAIPGVRRIRYLDARDLEMAGLYWKVVYEHEGEAWTIDNWVFAADEAHPRSVEVAGRLATLLERDPKSRATILGIKEDGERQGYRVHGLHAYRAVLEDGVTSLTEYQHWLGERDPMARSTWMPRRGDDGD